MMTGPCNIPGATTLNGTYSGRMCELFLDLKLELRLWFSSFGMILRLACAAISIGIFFFEKKGNNRSSYAELRLSLDVATISLIDRLLADQFDGSIIGWRTKFKNRNFETSIGDKVYGGYGQQ